MANNDHKPVETIAILDEDGTWTYLRSGSTLDYFEIQVDICNPALGCSDSFIKKAAFNPPYQMGDSFPEIMIFKILLGHAVPAISYNPPEAAQIDCPVAELGLSDGFLFNVKMRDALIHYQTTHQDLINNYGQSYNVDLHILGGNTHTQFDLERGTVGEATLAVMHGWGRSNGAFEKFYNIGYGPKSGTTAYSELGGENLEPDAPVRPPAGLKDLSDNCVSAGNSCLWRATHEYYINTTDWATRMATISDSVEILGRQESVQHQVSDTESPASTGIGDQSGTERTSATIAGLVGESPPGEIYTIDGSTLGIVVNTEYDLVNLPPAELPISELTSLGMLAALANQDKNPKWDFAEKGPQWTPENSQMIYRPSVEQVYPVGLIRREGWKGITWVEQDINDLEYVHYRHTNYATLDNLVHTTPLIKFDGLKSPTVRPRDKYKAMFVINKIKFDIISSQHRRSTSPTAEVLGSFRGLTAAEICELEAGSQAHWLPKQHVKEIKAKEDVYSIQDREKLRAEKQALQAEYAERSARVSELQGSDLSAASTDALLQVAEGVLPGSIPSAEELARRSGKLVTLKTSFDNIKSWSSSVADAMVEFQEELDEWKRSPPASTDYGSDSSSKGGQLVPEVNLKLEAANVRAIPDAIEKLLSDRSKGENWKSRDIVYTFKYFQNGAGMTTGLKVRKIKFENAFPGSFEEVESPIDSQHMFGYPLNLARTVGYLYNLEAMYDDISLLSRFLSGKSCKKGFKPLPAVSFVVRHTVPSPGVKPRSVAGNEWTSLLSPIKKEADRIFEALSIASDRAKNAAGEIGGRSPTNPYGPDWTNWDILPAANGICKIDKLFKKLVDRFDLISLICEFLKCLGLLPLPLGGGISIKLPKIPKFPVFDEMMIYMMVKEVITTIVAQTLCTIMKKILDFLKLPNCMANLYDEAYGALEDFPTANTFANIAVSMTDLGIPQGLMPAMQATIDDMSVTMTCSEMLGLYRGEASEQTVAYIRTLAARHDLELAEVIGDRASLLTFFEKMGFLMGNELTDLMGQCAEIEEQLTDAVPSSICYKKRALKEKIMKLHTSPTGQLSEEAQRAIEQVNREIQDQKNAVLAFANAPEGNPLATKMRDNPYVEIGNPKAIISEIPAPIADAFRSGLEILMKQPISRYYAEVDRYFRHLYTTFDKAVVFSSDQKNPFTDYVFSTAFARMYTYWRINENFHAEGEDRIRYTQDSTEPPTPLQCAAQAFLLDLLYLDIELLNTEEEIKAALSPTPGVNPAPLHGLKVKVGANGLPIPKPYSRFTQNKLENPGARQDDERHPDDPFGDIFHDYNPGRVIRGNWLSGGAITDPPEDFTVDDFLSWLPHASNRDWLSNTELRKVEGDGVELNSIDAPVYMRPRVPPNTSRASVDSKIKWLLPTSIRDGTNMQHPQNKWYLCKRDPYLPDFRAPGVSLPKVGRRGITVPRNVWEAFLAVSPGGMMESDLNPLTFPIPNFGVPPVPLNIGLGAASIGLETGQLFNFPGSVMNLFNAAVEAAGGRGASAYLPSWTDGIGLTLWGGVDGCPGKDCQTAMFALGENFLCTEEYAAELRVSYYNKVSQAIAMRLPELIEQMQSGLNTQQATDKVTEYLPGMRPVFYLGREHIAENLVFVEGRPPPGPLNQPGIEDIQDISKRSATDSDVRLNFLKQFEEHSAYNYPAAHRIAEPIPKFVGSRGTELISPAYFFRDYGITDPRVIRPRFGSTKYLNYVDESMYFREGWLNHDPVLTGDFFETRCSLVPLIIRSNFQQAGWDDTKKGFAREEAFKAIVRADMMDKIKKYSGPTSEWSEFGGDFNINPPRANPLPEEQYLDIDNDGNQDIEQNPWARAGNRPSLEEAKEFLGYSLEAPLIETFDKVEESIFEVFMQLISEAPFFEEDYTREIKKKIVGIPNAGLNQCIENAQSFPVSTFVNWEKFLADAMMSVMEEYSGPNVFQEMNHNESTPYEKGFQKVVSRLIVRLLIIEFTLKAAPGFTIVTSENIYNNDVIRKFIYHFINSKAGNHVGDPTFDRNKYVNHKSHTLSGWDSSLEEYWPVFIEGCKRATGLESPYFAITKIIDEELKTLAPVIDNILDPANVFIDRDEDGQADETGWNLRPNIVNHYITTRVPTTYVSREKKSVEVNGINVDANVIFQDRSNMDYPMEHLLTKGGVFFEAYVRARGLLTSDQPIYFDEIQLETLRNLREQAQEQLDELGDEFPEIRSRYPSLIDIIDRQIELFAADAGEEEGGLGVDIAGRNAALQPILPRNRDDENMNVSQTIITVDDEGERTSSIEHTQMGEEIYHPAEVEVLLSSQLTREFEDVFADTAGIITPDKLIDAEDDNNICEGRPRYFKKYPTRYVKFNRLVTRLTGKHCLDFFESVADENTPGSGTDITARAKNINSNRDIPSVGTDLRDPAWAGRHDAHQVVADPSLMGQPLFPLGTDTSTTLEKAFNTQGILGWGIQNSQLRARLADYTTGYSLFDPAQDWSWWGARDFGELAAIRRDHQGNSEGWQRQIGEHTDLTTRKDFLDPFFIPISPLEYNRRSPYTTDRSGQINVGSLYGVTHQVERHSTNSYHGDESGFEINNKIGYTTHPNDHGFDKMWQFILGEKLHRSTRFFALPTDLCAMDRATEYSLDNDRIYALAHLVDDDSNLDTLMRGHSKLLRTTPGGYSPWALRQNILRHQKSFDEYKGQISLFSEEHFADFQAATNRQSVSDLANIVLENRNLNRPHPFHTVGFEMVPLWDESLRTGEGQYREAFDPEASWNKMSNTSRHQVSFLGGFSNDASREASLQTMALYSHIGQIEARIVHHKNQWLGPWVLPPTMVAARHPAFPHGQDSRMSAMRAGNFMVHSGPDVQTDPPRGGCQNSELINYGDWRRWGWQFSVEGEIIRTDGPQLSVYRHDAPRGTTIRAVYDPDEYSLRRLAETEARGAASSGGVHSYATDSQRAHRPKRRPDWHRDFEMINRECTVGQHVRDPELYDQVYRYSTVKALYDAYLSPRPTYDDIPDVYAGLDDGGALAGSAAAGVQDSEDWAPFHQFSSRRRIPSQVDWVVRGPRRRSSTMCARGGDPWFGYSMGENEIEFAPYYMLDDEAHFFKLIGDDLIDNVIAADDEEVPNLGKIKKKYGEIWEEWNQYVIDLVGFAAPVFSDPGESFHHPDDLPSIGTVSDSAPGPINYSVITDNEANHINTIVGANSLILAVTGDFMPGHLNVNTTAGDRFGVDFQPLDAAGSTTPEDVAAHSWIQWSPIFQPGNGVQDFWLWEHPHAGIAPMLYYNYLLRKNYQAIAHPWTDLAAADRPGGSEANPVAIPEDRANIWFADPQAHSTDDPPFRSFQYKYGGKFSGWMTPWEIYSGFELVATEGDDILRYFTSTNLDKQYPEKDSTAPWDIIKQYGFAHPIMAAANPIDRADFVQQFSNSAQQTPVMYKRIKSALKTGYVNWAETEQNSLINKKYGFYSSPIMATKNDRLQNVFKTSRPLGFTPAPGGIEDWTELFANYDKFFPAVHAATKAVVPDRFGNMIGSSERATDNASTRTRRESHTAFIGHVYNSLEDMKIIGRGQDALLHSGGAPIPYMQNAALHSYGIKEMQKKTKGIDPETGRSNWLFQGDRMRRTRNPGENIIQDATLAGESAFYAANMNTPFADMTFLPDPQETNISFEVAPYIGQPVHSPNPPDVKVVYKNSSFQFYNELRKHAHNNRAAFHRGANEYRTPVRIILTRIDYKARDPDTGEEVTLDTECFGGWTMPDLMHGADIDDAGNAVPNNNRRKHLKDALVDVVNSYKAYVAEQATYDAYSERTTIWNPTTVYPRGGEKRPTAKTWVRKWLPRGNGQGKTKSIEQIIMEFKAGGWNLPAEIGERKDVGDMAEDLHKCMFMNSVSTHLNEHYYPSESYRNLFSKHRDFGYKEKTWDSALQEQIKAQNDRQDGGATYDRIKNEDMGALGNGFIGNFLDLPTGGNEVATPWDNWVGCTPNRRYIIHARDHSRLSWRPQVTRALSNQARKVLGHTPYIPQAGLKPTGVTRKRDCDFFGDGSLFSEWDDCYFTENGRPEFRSSNRIQYPRSGHFDVWYQDQGLGPEAEGVKAAQARGKALPTMNFFNALLDSAAIYRENSDRLTDFDKAGPLRNYTLGDGITERLETLNNRGFFSIAYLYSMAAQRQIAASPALGGWYPEGLNTPPSLKDSVTLALSDAPPPLDGTNRPPDHRATWRTVYSEFDSLIDSQMAKTPHYLLKDVGNVFARCCVRENNPNCVTRLKPRLSKILRGNASYRSRSTWFLDEGVDALTSSGQSAIPPIKDIIKPMSRERFETDDIVNENRLPRQGSPAARNALSPLKDERIVILRKFVDYFADNYIGDRRYDSFWGRTSSKKWLLGGVIKPPADDYPGYGDTRSQLTLTNANFEFPAQPPVQRDFFVKQNWSQTINKYLGDGREGFFQTAFPSGASAGSTVQRWRDDLSATKWIPNYDHSKSYTNIFVSPGQGVLQPFKYIHAAGHIEQAMKYGPPGHDRHGGAYIHGPRFSPIVGDSNRVIMKSSRDFPVGILTDAESSDHDVFRYYAGPSHRGNLNRKLNETLDNATNKAAHASKYGIPTKGTTIFGDPARGLLSLDAQRGLRGPEGPQNGIYTFLDRKYIRILMHIHDEMINNGQFSLALFRDILNPLERAIEETLRTSIRRVLDNTEFNFGMRVNSIMSAKTFEKFQESHGLVSDDRMGQLMRLISEEERTYYSVVEFRDYGQDRSTALEEPRNRDPLARRRRRSIHNRGVSEDKIVFCAPMMSYEETIDLSCIEDLAQLQNFRHLFEDIVLRGQRFRRKIFDSPLGRYIFSPDKLVYGEEEEEAYPNFGLWPIKSFFNASILHNYNVLTRKKEIDDIFDLTINSLLSLLRISLMKDFEGAAEMRVSLIDNVMKLAPSSDGPKYPCFAPPDQDIVKFLKEIGFLIFPKLPVSIIRSLAMLLDPAWRDIWEKFNSCQPRDTHVESLGWGTIKPWSVDQPAWFELGDDEPDRFKEGVSQESSGDPNSYLPLTTAFTTDLSYASLMLLAQDYPLATIAFGRSFGRFLNFVHSLVGPVGAGGNFSFRGPPCPPLDVEADVALGGTLVPHGDRYGHILTPFGALALSLQPVIDAGEALWGVESTEEKRRICPPEVEGAPPNPFNTESVPPCDPCTGQKYPEGTEIPDPLPITCAPSTNNDEGGSE